MRLRRLVPLLLIAAAMQAQQKPDFSGEWVLDLQRSKLEVPAPDSGKFTITHREPAFSLLRVFTRKDKQDKLLLDFTVGGPEVVYREPGLESRGRLYWQGDTLILDATMILPDGRQGADLVQYTLSEGGRVLTARESFRGPRVRYDNLWVFVRSSA